MNLFSSKLLAQKKGQNIIKESYYHTKTSRSKPKSHPQCCDERQINSIIGIVKIYNQYEHMLTKEFGPLYFLQCVDHRIQNQSPIYKPDPLNRFLATLWIRRSITLSIHLQGSNSNYKSFDYSWCFGCVEPSYKTLDLEFVPQHIYPFG
jgi:hypothetical protein